jgi:hypothetical protein
MLTGRVLDAKLTSFASDEKVPKTRHFHDA